MNFKFQFLKTASTVIALFSAQTAFSQYAPPVGQAGTTAMYKDSSAFIGWATACQSVRGLQDISTPTLGYASVGDDSMATGKAQSNAVLSLGDGGSATCTFINPITNGPGYDFAVFENGFDDLFLELAFVEVSSDGVNFVRFPSTSLTQYTSQTGSFGSTDATKINNLAGKYRGGYGTPFDLQDLAFTSVININSITHVRIIDVVGSINDAYATKDSQGNKINDPWPTAFPSGGFDLDAIGVIHEKITVGIEEQESENLAQFYPNPVSGGSTLHVIIPERITSLQLTDSKGLTLRSSNNETLETQGLAAGIYFVTVRSENRTVVKKIVVQ